MSTLTTQRSEDGLWEIRQVVYFKTIPHASIVSAGGPPPPDDLDVGIAKELVWRGTAFTSNHGPFPSLEQIVDGVDWFAQEMRANPDHIVFPRMEGATLFGIPIVVQ